MLTLGRLAVTLVACLAVAGLSLVATGLLLGRILSVVDLFAQFVLPAVVAGATVALALVAARHFRFAAALAALVLSCAAVTWPYQRAVSPAPSQRHVRLLSFNVFAPNPLLAEVVRGVRAANADIVVLLEITPRNRDGLRALDTDYPYRIECWQKSRCDILLLSRVPLRDLEPSLTVIGVPPAWAAAELEIAGCRFAVVAAHLSLPFPFHRPGHQGARAEALARTIAAIAMPKIVAGDFNGAPWGAIVSDIAEMAKLNVLAGFGATWPTTLPKALGIPIDHVLASSDFTFLSRELRAIPGSDHRGVLTEITLPSADRCARSP